MFTSLEEKYNPNVIGFQDLKEDKKGAKLYQFLIMLMLSTRHGMVRNFDFPFRFFRQRLRRVKAKSAKREGL